ncbi:MAG: hypothetical protein RLZZ628_2621 [Bacteroidota bacterium]|jgi:hypothetical protein
MKNRFIILLGFIIISFSTSCTVNDPLPVPSSRPVVDAYLVANQPIDIYVARQAPFSDTTITDLSLKGLSIDIKSDAKTIHLVDQGNGHYTSKTKIDSNTTYTLRFDYAGKTITATTFVPSHTQNFATTATSFVVTVNPNNGRPTFPDPARLSWTSAPDAYYLVVAEATDAVPELIFSFGGGSNRRFFRQAPFQGNNTDLQGQLFRYYGNYNLILFRINVEYASLYADNGTSSINLTTPYTNVTNGLGIFTGMASDTLKFAVTK